MNEWLSYDIVRFKIELGVEQKFICKHVTLRHATSLLYSGPATGLAVVAMLDEPRPCLLPRPTSTCTASSVELLQRQLSLRHIR